MAGPSFRRNYISNKIKADLNQRFSLANKNLVVRGNFKKLFDELRNAHWHYLDFHCPQPNSKSTRDEGSLPIAFEDFCEEMLRFIPEWKVIQHKWRQLYDSWRQQTSKAVRCGGIIIDHTFSYVLLVRGFFRDGYQFPAGKKDNDGEPYETCAIRELEEETGFDISKLIRPSLFFERKVFNCLRRYFLITGVNPESLNLRPSSRNEIKMILWMKVDDLPEDNESAKRLGYSPRDFVLCMPWAKQLKSYCRYLREGELPFKALQLCETLSEESEDATDDHEVINKMKTLDIHSSNLKECNTKKDGRLHTCESNSVGNRSPQTGYNCNGNSSFDKNKQKRRHDRRKNRSGYNSGSDRYHSQTDDEKVSLRSNKESVRCRKGQRTKDSHDMKTSNNSSSDSGYSDQSDQMSVQIDDISCSPINDDFLMVQAILALKQIRPTPKT